MHSSVVVVVVVAVVSGTVNTTSRIHAVSRPPSRILSFPYTHV